MSFADVERNIALYGRKAKEGSLSLDDMSGGTFTISNGGVFGSLYGTPIINPPAPIGYFGYACDEDAGRGECVWRRCGTAHDVFGIDL
jgi:hypothetical protein